MLFVVNSGLFYGAQITQNCASISPEKIAKLHDNFKYINDTWGHATGDRVLIEIAKRLAEFGGLRHKAYRLGGDEFAMVLYDVQSESEVQQICSALTQIFNRPFDLHNGHQTTMTLSIGYAMTIAHASAEKLQELADYNMYQAKHQRAEKLVR